MTLIGFAFKIAAAPFHLWAPDAYQGAPISRRCLHRFRLEGRVLCRARKNLAARLSDRSKAALIGMRSLPAGRRFLRPLRHLSILMGNLVALAQQNVRRLLAYSAVAHAGYTLLGLIAGGREGFSATLFYTTIYALTLVGAFGVVGFVRRETGGDDFTDFAGLRDARRCSPVAWRSSSCRSPDLPPLAGFFGKFYLFSTALRAADRIRAALAGRPRALRQPDLALLLPRHPES